MSCQRCQQGDPWESESATLTCDAGDVEAHLCLGCLNEWANLVADHPLRQELLTLDAHVRWLEARAMAGDCPEEREFIELEKTMLAMRRRWRTVALKFIRPIED